jgi:hypothetical protein
MVQLSLPVNGGLVANTVERVHKLVHDAPAGRAWPPN